MNGGQGFGMRAPRITTMLAAGLEDGMRRFVVCAVGAAFVVLSVACSGGDKGNKYPDEVRKSFLGTC